MTSPLDWPAPAVDRALFLRQGFLIIDVIPPQHLAAMRASFEALVELQKAVWAADAEDSNTQR
jgi:hypothetical protein